MLSIVWFFMILLSFVCGILTNNMENVTKSINIGAMEAVNLSISMLGVMCFWSGIMEILIKSKLIDKISVFFQPILKLLFKTASKDAKAMQYISSNFVANLLGLSNASTPMGLQAVDRIYHIHKKKGTPNELIMLIVINCSSLQLIPTTISAIRLNYGSDNPFDIMPAIWVTSIISVLSGILVVKFCSRFNHD